MTTLTKEKYNYHFCEFNFIQDGQHYPACYPLNGYVNGKEFPRYRPRFKFEAFTLDCDDIQELEFHYKKLKQHMNNEMLDTTIEMAFHYCSCEFMEDNEYEFYDSIIKGPDLYEIYVKEFTNVDKFFELSRKIKDKTNEKELRKMIEESIKS
tara:strand:- start:2414 stop:2869 length:456 start_codon:yes stop_codon:yes gene_type:complete